MLLLSDILVSCQGPVYLNQCSPETLGKTEEEERNITFPKFQDSVMKDTTGQIVFASRFSTFCNKKQVGGVYCLRTVQTVSDI